MPHNTSYTSRTCRECGKLFASKDAKRWHSRAMHRPRLSTYQAYSRRHRRSQSTGRNEGAAVEPALGIPIRKEPVDTSQSARETAEAGDMAAVGNNVHPLDATASNRADTP